MNTLLLHTCCAPCSVQCVDALREEGLKPDLFWYNPNIHPFTEYRARRDCLVLFAETEGLELIREDEYGLRRFFESPVVREARCAFCYQLRLEKTAAEAAEKGYAAFSTTLLISPYQNHELIIQTGEGCAARHGVEFLGRDFRPRFREGQRRARERNYYLQKYCGCIFSEEERYIHQGAAHDRRPLPSL